MLKGLKKLSIIQAKLFLREPPAIFFTLVFPALLLLLFGALFGAGNKPLDDTGFGAVDGMTPGFIAVIIATVAFMGIPVTVATARERKILRRFRAARIHPAAYFLADVIVNFFMAIFGMLLLLLMARVVYGLRFGGYWPSILAVFTLSAMAFYAAGYLIAALAPTTRIAQITGQVIFFPLMFLSGAAVPLSEMPENIRKIANFIPLTHSVKPLAGMWFGDPLNEHLASFGILIVILCLGTLVSIKSFRWE
jgi:ABC-2 type transport system permease protein